MQKQNNLKLVIISFAHYLRDENCINFAKKAVNKPIRDHNSSYIPAAIVLFSPF